IVPDSRAPLGVAIMCYRFLLSFRSESAMKSPVLALAVLICLPSALLRADATAQAGDILEATGVTVGVIGLHGCDDGELTDALRTGDAYVVHGLDADAERVQQTRQALKQKGVYGPVSVDRLQGAQLPYIDNMVNLVVVDQQGDVAMDEILRV